MKRSKFSLSFYKLASIRMGELVPFGLVEVLPGDTFQHSMSALIRTIPLLAPVMHPVHVRIHHWFVPHRLVWEDWEDFITGGPDGMDASVFPTVTLSWAAGPPETGTGATGGLADYLGCATGVNNLEVSALPFRAYNLIYNEWYRDQDLTTPLDISLASGADATTDLVLQNVAWEKDYFTSARPFTQKGPAISIPLSGNAPVIASGDAQPVFVDDGGSDTRKMQYETGQAGPRWQGGAVGTTAAMEWNDPKLQADLSGVSAADINDLRLAFALQRYEEARARYGSRYTEYLRYLGVRSSDARLQRPEYLGGGKQTIQFSEVLQTAEGTDPVGELRGHGIGALRSNRYRRFFEEHGYVISLLSVRPRTMYVQGVPRTWNRRSKEDFWQRELQHIGQQEVLEKEIYGASATPNATFGYQDRYDEYRRQESHVAGEMRNNVYSFWHMARIFSSTPTLNSSFVVSNPTERIFAASTNDELIVMGNHSLQARRMVAGSGKSYIY